MRKAWSEHVNETYRKQKRKNKEITRREAMKIASESWPNKKRNLRENEKEKRNLKKMILNPKP